MITSDELNKIPIFACLEEAERQRFANKAADVHLKSGEWLIREGDVPYFYVLLEGDLVGGRDTASR